MIFKLFWRLVSNQYLMEEYYNLTTILTCHLYANDEDEACIKDILAKYIEPEIQRREL